MLVLCGKGTFDACRAEVEALLQSGQAVVKLADIVEAQGGDRRYIEDVSLFETAHVLVPFTASAAGFVAAMDAEGVGIAAAMLGAGRETVDDSIDYSAGIVFHKKTGDAVKPGDALATLHTGDINKVKPALEKLEASITMADTAPAILPLIYA